MNKQVDELLALALSLKDPCCDTETTMQKLKANLEAALTPGEPVYWNAVLDPEQCRQQPNPRLHRVGFRSERSAKTWIEEERQFRNWSYELVPLVPAK